jgi:hypothetical protein
MRRYWSGLFVAGVLAAGATLGAQAQGQNPAAVPPADSNAAPGVQQAPRAPAAQVRTQDTITISGCLQNAPAEAGRSSTDARFVLANAEMTASGRPALGGAVGTAGTKADNSYRLEGDEKMISPHLNHQVRVRGTLQGSLPAPAGEKPAVSPATLKVESVEMVAATCASAGEPGEVAPRSVQPVTPAVPARPTEPGRSAPQPQPDPARPAEPPPNRP